MAAQYPSIPLPTTDPAGLYQSVLALKQTVDTLTGGVGTGSAAAVTNTALTSANAPNTSAIATNTSAIAALQTKTTGYEAAWTPYTPTVTPSSGAFTTVSAAGAFQQIGKMVSFICNITITTIGTASGAVSVSLPVGTLKRTFACAGVETGVSGKSIGAFNYAASTTLAIRYYDTTNVIAAGVVLTISGTYEAA